MGLTTNNETVKPSLGQSRWWISSCHTATNETVKQSHGCRRWWVSRCPTVSMQFYSLQPLSDLAINPKHFSLPSFVWTEWLDERDGGFRQVHWTGMCQSLQNCGLDCSLGLLFKALSALINPPEDVRTSCMSHCSFVLVRIHFPLQGSTMRTVCSSVHSVWPGMMGVL